MNAERNPGINQDAATYPFMVELGNRGTNTYEVFYITAFMQCTCGRINCQHVQAVRDMLNADTSATSARYLSMVDYQEIESAGYNILNFMEEFPHAFARMFANIVPGK